jgi:hypothetical protein
VDFGLGKRSNDSRRALGERLADFDFHRDVDRAEALRATLAEALGVLRELRDDEELWRAAVGAVEGASGSGDELLAQAGAYAGSLPGLLELFGFREPPPPPARDLVDALVTALRDVTDGQSPAEEVDEAHRALDELLERALPLADAEPWFVAQLASETIPALEMAVPVVAGAAVSAISAVVAGSVALSALTGGVGTLVPLLVLGGVRLGRRRRNARVRATRLARERELLESHQFPAVRDAVCFHLEAISCAREGAVAGNAGAVVDLGSHLDALVDVTRRFVLADPHFTTAVGQEAEHGNPGPLTLVNLLHEVYRTATEAKALLYPVDGLGERLGPLLDALQRSADSLQSVRL